MKKKVILVISPHTDDAEFGCGGSIVKFIEDKADVYYVAFSIAEKSVPSGFPKNILETEVKKATGCLGISKENLVIFKYEVRKLNYFRQDILEDLVKIKKGLEPDLVFMPSLDDIHQDHHTVSRETLRAFKTTSILGYELPWNSMNFKTQSFIKLTSDHIENKITALKEYKSQMHRSYINEELVKGLARLRGAQIKYEYAEAFEVIRWIH